MSLRAHTQCDLFHAVLLLTHVIGAMAGLVLAHKVTSWGLCFENEIIGRARIAQRERFSYFASSFSTRRHSYYIWRRRYQWRGRPSSYGWRPGWLRDGDSGTEQRPQ